MLCERRRFLELGVAGLAGTALVPKTRQQAGRPRFKVTTTEAFDASAIPAYRGNHARVYRYIDQNLERHIANLQRWIRQPSVSAQGLGIEEMARVVMDDLKSLGFKEVELVRTDGHPGVWGYYDAGVPKTLMVYMMYDVQPVEPEDWRSPPFEANLVEHELGTVLMGRGATNQKGPERAFLNAVEAILAAEGRLPVNLMITAEGEEEISSPHYPQIVDRYEERLRRCAGAFFPFNSQGPDGEAELDLGVKGILYLELEAKGGPHGGPTRAEIHGSYKAVVDSPVWRLVQALASMVTPDGNTILIPGYYDAVRPPTEEEERLINGVLRKWNEPALKRILGVERFIDGWTGADALLAYLYHPTLNINGIWGGYTGEGSKTILPHQARAKVDSRLPPDMRPERALAMIRSHLERQGFSDIDIRQLGAYPPSQTSVEAPLVRAAISVFNKYGHPPAVWPRLAGSAPFYQFTERLKLPLVFAGLGHGSGAHAPNEYMVIHPRPGSRIAGLAEVEKSYADLLFALAAV
jgi:acetylornithine deacetylase/succinyl-diaminopimelate desuccinylase-like protein